MITGPDWTFDGLKAMVRAGIDSGMNETEIMQLLLDKLPICTATAIKSAIAAVMDQRQACDHCHRCH